MPTIVDRPPGARAAYRAPTPESRRIEVSVVMPCLNEAETIAACIAKANAAFATGKLVGEVVIADNGSTDGSQAIAESLGARVVEVPVRGYGAALLGGIDAARGRYIVMADADDSYDFGDVPRFVERLREGYDLVMGNRFRGGIKPGAMPPLHRYVGNPVLTGIGRLFFRSPCGDFHCGMRGFSKDAVGRMDLRTTGMEFASEMVVKASILGLRISEIPTTLSPDGRSRPPHLRSWRDGWRHLRFLMMYSPRWTFLVPGVLLIAIGTMIAIWLLPGPRRVGGVTFDVHTLLFAAGAVLLGAQAVGFAIFARVFATRSGLLPPDEEFEELLGVFSLEVGVTLGLVVLLTGLGLAVYALGEWRSLAFGEMPVGTTIRLAIVATTLMVLGAQSVFASFFLSILGLQRR
jgi:hypothetical protein